MMKCEIFKKCTIALLVFVLVTLLISVGYKKNNDAMAFTGNKSSIIAVVIDDFGNSSQGTEEMLNLNIPITAAVMPFLPTSVKDAQSAHDKGHGVILHLPMEPEKGKLSWLGPRGITTNLKDEEIELRVGDAIKELKYAEGINNHTGSKAMKDERVVKAVMRVAKNYDLIFLDSKTTAGSQGKKVCQELQVPYFERDIFLDNNNNVKAIENQLDKASELALRKGYAIVIGHVGPAGGHNTVTALKNKIRSMEEKGITFVKLKDIPVKSFE